MGALIAKNLRLYMLRKSRGWNQLEAARRLNIPINVYARIEQGKTKGKIENWDKIQELYNIPDSEMWEVIQGKL